jgi:AhpD family alkylhydroperoxidase
MPRIPYVKPDEHPELRELAQQICEQRGGHVSELYAMLLNSPPVCAGWLHLLTAVRHESKLPGIHREAVIVRVAIVNEAHYEYKSHANLLLKEGMTQQQLDALADWENSNLLDPALRAVLAYADAMTRNIKVSNETFEAVRAFYDNRQIMELTALVAAYNLVSRFLVALEVGA